METWVWFLSPNQNLCQHDYSSMVNLITGTLPPGHAKVLDWQSKTHPVWEWGQSLKLGPVQHLYCHNHLCICGNSLDKDLHLGLASTLVFHVDFCYSTLGKNALCICGRDWLPCERLSILWALNFLLWSRVNSCSIDIWNQVIFCCEE